MTPTLSPELEQLKKRVLDSMTAAEKLHQRYRPKWERYFSLWSNYTDTVRQTGQGQPRDWDPGVRGWWKRQIGDDLFIPMVFSTVETVLARALDPRPKMLVMPRPLRDLPPEYLDVLSDNARNHQLLLDAQQDRIKYELVLQEIGRDGFMLGIGIQKTGWQNTRRVVHQYVPHIFTGQLCVEHREEDVEDPFAICVDPFDFFWDPSADGLGSYASKPADYAIHRVWRNSAYVSDKVTSGEWGLLPDLTQEDYGRGGAGGKYDTVWAKRMQALGMTTDLQSEDLHEVLEFHNGTEVVTLLDRQWPVRHEAEQTWHGELPFQAFRPTTVPHRLVGKGEVEPVEDLQLELNTLRTQRMDNNTFTMMASYAYQEGMVDPADIQFGPGILIPTLGDPREFLFPIQQQPLPNGSYQESSELKEDADRTSGVSDVVSGADPTGGVSNTATGAQIVEQAANRRIVNKARRLQVEIIAEGARQWIALNQQHIRSPRPMMAPALPTPDQPDQRYQWVRMGPLELAGEFMVSPEGGASLDSTSAKLQRAQIRYQLLAQNPAVDQRVLAEATLRDVGDERPELFLAAPQQPAPDEVPPEALDMLQKVLAAHNVPNPGALIAQAVQAAKADQLRQQQGQPQMGQPPMQGQPQQGQPPQLPPGQPVAA